MPGVVAFLSSKGGVGKTGLCANVAAQAVHLLRPERVLAVDLDVSGDLAWDLATAVSPPTIRVLPSWLRCCAGRRLARLRPGAPVWMFSPAGRACVSR